ncbi:MAG: hypothetical protein IJA89_07605, partial [Clostridia bacterium]|nr:hypothetical protein [Clostridia bacterium]
EIKVFAPEGLVADYQKNMFIHGTHKTNFHIKFTAEKHLAARNDIVIAIYCVDHVKPTFIPLMIAGK